MKIKLKTIAICIALPLIVGGVSGFIANIGDGMSIFAALQKPPLTPPGWVFPVAWSVLYILMGFASYLVLTSGAPPNEIVKALKLYGLQLVFNFFWSIWFFNLQLYAFSFVWLVILWFLILATVVSFSRISKPAAYLLLPYLLWVTFAGYLNLGIAILN